MRWKWLGDTLVEDSGRRNVVLLAHDNALHTRGPDGRLVLLDPDSPLGHLLAAAPELLDAARAQNAALNACIRYLCGTGLKPDPEVVARAEILWINTRAKVEGRR